MIRHDISREELLDKIEALKPGWMDRAAERRAAAIAAGHVGESDGIWSEIKSVYMELQGYKCMYCEKQLPMPSDAATAEGKVEYDVEHYRPKNGVQPWPTVALLKAREIDYADELRQGESDGYPRLAFDPFNYGVSCKTCNSELKGNRFPIVGTTNARLSDRSKLDAKELPCLLLPIGEDAIDPETWLEWLGPTVRARKSLKKPTEIRAKTLVDFFELDTRGDLLRVRAELVVLLWPQLEEQKGTSRSAKEARAFVAEMTASTAAFAGCARAFVALFEENREEAKRWYQLSRRYVISRDPAAFRAT